MRLFLFGLGALLIIGSIVFGAIPRIYAADDDSKKIPKPFIVLGICLGVFFFVLSDTLVIIPTGFTGVKSTFGQIEGTTLNNGANWKIPFVQKIEQVNNKQQDILFEDQIWSETKERTALYYAGVTVTYQINPEKSAWIYANVSNYKDTLITQALVASAIKTSSKTLSSTDATNRGIMEPLAMENIQKSLDQKYGENVVFINKVVIANTDFEDSYNKAIADKQTAQLNYEQQQIENQKKIEAAEADAKVKTTQAQAEADAEVIKAQGEADANKLLNDSLTDKILRQQYINKWDGSLPRVSSDSQNMLYDVTGEVSKDVNSQTTE